MFIETLKTTVTPIQEYSENSWHALVDYVTVKENGDMVFTMKNGQKIYDSYILVSPTFWDKPRIGR